jgi:tRNA U34 5-carboxymethylaminomethyl modifying GTPase MnmE/TrmE
VLFAYQGPDAFEITKVFFRPKSKKTLDRISVKTSTLGSFTVDEEIIDEVLLTKFNKPHSYTWRKYCGNSLSWILLYSTENNHKLFRFRN